jgi:hypothetical protein
MASCPECGERIEPRAGLSMNCGRLLEDDEDHRSRTATPRQREARLRKVKSLIGAVLCFLGVGTVLLGFAAAASDAGRTAPTLLVAGTVVFLTGFVLRVWARYHTWMQDE